ncbi:MAG: CpsD/CapB family tyrosine-protein kinase [Ruminococcaceae bacterium]|nr:CpsD/CapB family tyrosine-protein kinase [Oscillospiraceae bacterium]
MENFGAELFDDMILPVAGKVNFNTSVSNSFITKEAFKTLRSNLLFCSKDIKTILITSTIENEGKTTVTTELARSFSEINKKTLLIDADMRKSVILRKTIKTQNIMGLSELLSGQAEIGQVLYNTQIPNFDVIFSGRFPPNPVELLSSESFAEVISKLRNHYDYILIDTPPVYPIIDAAVIGAHCDGSVIVVSPGKPRIDETLYVKDQLEKGGCKILGVVVNEMSAKNRDRSLSHKRKYKYYGK